MEAIAKLDQTKLCNHGHWTADNPLRMVRWVASDFIAQVETRIEQIPGFTYAHLADRLKVSLGRVSQMMNSPGNFTLKNGVLYAGAVGMHAVVVTYPAGCNNGSPISGDVFRTCWEIAGCPTNMFEIHEATVGFASTSGGMAAIGHAWVTPPINAGGGTYLDGKCTGQTDAKPLIMNTPIHAQATS